MTTAVEDKTLSISVEGHCTTAPGCGTLVTEEYVGTFYAKPTAPLSIAELADTPREWLLSCSRVSRQNAGHCERLGYRHERINRRRWGHDLYALRSSKAVRQGRGMPAAYMHPERYTGDPLTDECPRHCRVVHGVIAPEGNLVAYAVIVQCGDVARLNTILGHWDYLHDRVMWLLMVRAIGWHIEHGGARYCLYYTHDSGNGDGLRYFKERLGFRPHLVAWEDM